MHPSSLENMRAFHDRYVVPQMADKARPRVLDVGGVDVNGGYREVYHPGRYDLVVADIEAQPGVDVVLEDPYRLPIDDESFDVVISGQMLEHCEFFWLTFKEMVRVLRRDGLIVMIAPSAGPIHRYPVDCYRFYPDAYRALAKWAGCELVDVHHDERGPWNDLVGVFARTPVPRRDPHPAPVPLAPLDLEPGSVEEERAPDGVTSLEVLRRLHERVAPSFYVEIGVRNGHSLALAHPPAVGVDPDPEVTVPLPEGTEVVVTTSDHFFATATRQTLPRPVELALVDGLHLFEFALRDFMNLERRMRPGGLIVIDDVSPNHPAQAERQRRTRVWTGDVWKLQVVLAKHRPDLVLVPVDCSPTGLLLVIGADPDNRTLWDRYNPIVREQVEDQPPPPEVLSRQGALDPSAPVLDEILDVVADRSLPRLRRNNLVRAALRRARG